VPETRLTSCDLLVLADETAEPVVPVDVAGVGLVVFWERPQGSGLSQCAVRAMGRARFLRRVRVESGDGLGRYPFTLPAVGWLARSGGLSLSPGVTFLVGGTGAGSRH